MLLDRRQIILKPLENCKLDYNYNYELMKLLYNSMMQVNEAAAHELHEIGFAEGKKIFKLYNYTLRFSNAEFLEDYIYINEDTEVKLIVSGREDIINLIVKGLVKFEEINILGCIFEMKNMISNSRFHFRQKMCYKVYSPIIETTWENGKTIYLNPLQKDFYKALAQNLKRKYRLIYNKDYEGEIYFDIENILKVKEKKIKNIKNQYKKGSGGYDIWIEADPDMQKIAYYLGLGQNSSLGAGCIGYLAAR